VPPKRDSLPSVREAEGLGLSAVRSWLRHTRRSYGGCGRRSMPCSLA
jgi:hypothetical protein